MAEVVCTNGQFPPDTLLYWGRFGIVHPKQDSLYTIRDVIKNTMGTVGLLLEEIHNPKILIAHPILGNVMMEPNFDINRFSSLLGDKLLVAELMNEFKKKNQSLKTLDNVSTN